MYKYHVFNCYVMVLRFEETPEGLDIDLGAVDKEEIAHKFSNGDNVLVVEGELQNLQVQLPYTLYIGMSLFIFFILGHSTRRCFTRSNKLNFKTSLLCIKYCSLIFLMWNLSDHFYLS